MKKTKLTRSLLAACSIVALSAVMYGCVHSGGDGATDEPAVVDPPEPDTSLDDAQTAAMNAATAADTAADAAEMAANAQTANMAADEASYAVAQNAAMRARAAANAAKAASDAAAAAMDAAAAEAQQAIAEAKQAEAEAEQGYAMMYAQMVADAQQAIDDENQRQMDVAAARTTAMGSDMDADADAAKAEAAADAAEATAAGTPGAMAARQAATDARTAANAAKAAHDAIMDDMTKAEADAKAAEAAGAASDANTAYMTAKSENDTIQTAASIGEQQQEARDIAAAQDAASAAASAAQDSLDDAADDADAARAAANNARAAANRAADARTNATKAAAEATAAETAATAAEAAEGNAMTARNAADDANTAAMGATTSGDAEMYQGQAETAQGNAATEAMTASTERGNAETAAADAATAANTHVLGLFMQANAYDIDMPIIDDSGTPADEAMTVMKQRATEVASIGAAMKAAAMMATGDQEGAAEPTAAWPSDDPGTTDNDEGEAAPVITVNGLTVNIVSDTVGDADADPVVMANAEMIDGVDGFMHGYDMSMGEVRVIAFTDREQQVRAQAAANFARYIDYGEGDGETIAITEVGNLGESPDGGMSYPGTLTKTDVDAVMGTFTCTADNCSIALDGDGTGVTAISGYTFTGTRAAKAAVAADDNDDYLLFGLWLDEAAGGSDSFGSFGGGGQEFTSGNVNALTGTASYSGEAVGAHHMTGSGGVSWFEGDANLTADFDDDMIEGSIDNISVNGGDAMSESIELVETTFANANTFNGAAVMGSQSGPGQATHAYNGTWSGGFFNNPAADATGADAQPGSVAGTFGVTRDVTTGMGDDAMTTTESFVGAFGAHKD